MLDDRSPRIHAALTIWTLLLIGLVLVEIRRSHPGLTALLVPYLALMAWHGMSHLGRMNPIEPAMALDDKAESSPEGQPDEAPDFPGSGGYSVPDDAPMTTSPRRDEEQVAPPSRRTRVRRRSRAPEPDPTTASSWVQVRPGRFVRVDETPPEQSADKSDSGSRIDEPHGAPVLDAPEVTSEAGSILDLPEAAAAGFEPVVNHAEKDAAETMGPEDREIGVEATFGALATTTFLVGCPAGDPGDRDSSAPTSGAGAEIGPDDRREDLLGTDMPEMDLG